MEAKETVMSMDEMTRANEEAHLSPFANPYQEKCVIARAQAEISFKAGYEQREKDPLDKEDRCDKCYKQGIREVVDYVEKIRLGNKIPFQFWEAKLKEWGIE